MANATEPSRQEASRFRLFGTPIRFHFTVLILLAVFVFLGFQSKRNIVFQLVYFGGILCSILIHELAHALVARRFGINTREIVMFPVGGVAVLDSQPRKSQELWIAVAGPAASILLGLIYLAFSGFQVASAGIFLRQAIFQEDNLLLSLAKVNLMIGAFNLIPAFPMDGGRILRAILAIVTDEERATRFATRIGVALAFAMCVYGVLNGEPWLVFVAMFVFLGASQEALASRSRALTSGYRVSAAMLTDFQTLEHGSTLRDAAKRLLATSQEDFPVVHSSRVLGLLTRRNLIRGLAEDPDSLVSNFMDREYLQIRQDAGLVDAMAQIQRADSSALILDEDENLLGMLTSANISEFLMLRQIGIDPEASA
jgi:Zn-dependent protease/predicted transcriptional regulator